MHRDAGPPNWKFICINFQCGGIALQCIYLSPKSPTYDQTDKHKTTKGLWMDGRTFRHIILLLMGFEPVAYDHMRCVQLQAARMNFYCQLKAVFQTKIPI